MSHVLPVAYMVSFCHLPPKKMVIIANQNHSSN